MSSVLQTGKNKPLDYYPSLTKEHLEAVGAALCPFSVKLPKKIQTQIFTVCEQFLNYKKETASTPWQDSVLNSVDFHYSSEKLKIIEANTNASGFLLSNLLLKNSEQALAFETDLIKSFRSVFDSDFKKVFIIDKAPEQEKMFAEFLMFKDFFKRNSINVEICTTSSIPSVIQSSDESLYVYNRDTDFYLEENLTLKDLWLNKEVILSTSPSSYQNIADKKYDTLNRDLMNQGRFKELKEASLETLNLTPENKDAIWSKRKTYFFKPSSSFGSKGVYAGKSVSRKKYETFTAEYLAQELHPPGKISDGEKDWKFDIRAFFSEQGVQKIIARVYQGQLTNFSNLGGGFALIKWID